MLSCSAQRGWLQLRGATPLGRAIGRRQHRARRRAGQQAGLGAPALCHAGRPAGQQASRPAGQQASRQYTGSTCGGAPVLCHAGGHIHAEASAEHFVLQHSQRGRRRSGRGTGKGTLLSVWKPGRHTKAGQVMGGGAVIPTTGSASATGKPQRHEGARGRQREGVWGCPLTLHEKPKMRRLSGRVRSALALNLQCGHMAPNKWGGAPQNSSDRATWEQHCAGTSLSWKSAAECCNGFRLQ